mmetsp:Transcript_88819/g.133133  ORF Transcript_88819/g.133133 Transcript_88819/m.133133 type:complete len:152 (+) Transcript_88819:553-1008(+)
MVLIELIVMLKLYICNWTAEIGKLKLLVSLVRQKNLARGDTAHKQNRAVYNAHNNAVNHQIAVDDSYAKNYGRGFQSSQTAPTSNVVKDKLSEQDRQLEELSANMARLQNIAGTAKNEVGRQNAQLDKLNHRTEQAIHRTHDSSYKMQRLM